MKGPDTASPHYAALARQAQERLDRLDGTAMDAACEPIPYVMHSKASSRTTKLIMLRKIANEATAPVSREAICRKGCSHCCHQHVLLSELEAKIIERETGHKAQPVAGMDIRRFEVASAEYQRRYIGVPCTFLVDGACSIHEHRPMICRTHFSLADDAKWCDTARGLGVVDVPIYHNRELDAARALLITGTKLADIREFFK